MNKKSKEITCYPQHHKLKRNGFPYEAFPEGNFTHAQEGKAKNPSEPFSRNKNISSGRETSWEEKNEKPSVRKELGDIRKEQEEKRKRPDRRKNARESRKKRKNMKTKGR